MNEIGIAFKLFFEDCSFPYFHTLITQYPLSNLCVCVSEDSNRMILKSLYVNIVVLWEQAY